MSWVVETQCAPDEDILKRGHRHISGNGLYGFRGTLEEDLAEDAVALNIAGVFDGVQGRWRESLNAPNPFFTTVKITGKDLRDWKGHVLDHSQKTLLSRGLHIRETVYGIEGKRFAVRAERFLSMAEPHVMAMRYSLEADAEIEIEIRTGIDCRIWELNGPHYESFCFSQEGAGGVLAVSQEKKHRIRLQSALIKDEGFHFVGDDRFIGKKTNLTLKPKEPFIFDKIVVLTVDETLEQTKEYHGEALRKGYDLLREEHEKTFGQLWKASDVEIDADEDTQKALRHSIYNLLILRPHKDFSIPARGLSGQVYKGAVFWDTEIFLLPFFLNTDPEAARRLLAYRAKTLPAAKRKAEEYGYSGAFYAWESQETGEDACSDFNVTDVFTKRPVRTHFKDKQIHVSGAVTLAFFKTYEQTGDFSLLKDGGAEVILECARFYYSRLHYSPARKRYEIIDVVGPDEYHERVHNNAYTNRLVREVFFVARRMIDIVSEKDDRLLEALGGEEALRKEIDRFADAAGGLYQKEPDENSIIEQFDGYHRLEDVDLASLRKRLAHPREYWGSDHGIATPTKIIKQADVVARLVFFDKDHDEQVKRANYEFYEPRTEHGSSLSAPFHALLASRIGLTDEAFTFFQKASRTDLDNQTKDYAGDIYIGGTHPAASGGAYMAAVFGFAGVDFSGKRPKLDPALPDAIRAMRFSFHHRGKRYLAEIDNEGHSLKEVPA